MAAVAEKAARSQMLSDAPPKRILCQRLRGDGSGSFVGSRIRRILFPGGVTDFTAVTDGFTDMWGEISAPSKIRASNKRTDAAATARKSSCPTEPITLPAVAATLIPMPLDAAMRDSPKGRAIPNRDAPAITAAARNTAMRRRIRA